MTERRAYAADALTARTASALKGAWWGAQSWAIDRATRKGRAASPPARVYSAEPPPANLLRARWAEAFAKDAADIGAGLYPWTERPPADLSGRIEGFIDLVREARAVDARRARKGGVEVREEGNSSAYPVYYRQNFHFQSGGWLTSESARRYEAQVEALFSGTAGAMRRRALSLLAKAWRDVDHRGRTIVDIACGSGAFLIDLKAAFPRAAVTGLDLSPPYLAEARRRSGAAVVQADAARLPYPDASLDALTCVYLFHELPPRLRPVIAAEFARVLKPGGVLAFADSVQGGDEPELTRLLEAFPALFHEPYFDSYQAEDLDALFEGAGFSVEGRDKAFLTKALLLRKG